MRPSLHVNLAMSALIAELELPVASVFPAPPALGAVDAEPPLLFSGFAVSSDPQATKHTSKQSLE